MSKLISNFPGIIVIALFIIFLFMPKVSANGEGSFSESESFIIWVLFNISLVVMMIFVYVDVKKREKNVLLWLGLVYISHIVGLIYWLLIRPPLKSKSSSKDTSMKINEHTSHFYRQ